MASCRKRIVTKFLSLLESELEDSKWGKLYDDQYLIRMGQKTERIGRQMNRTAILMIFFDILTLIILSGIEVNIKILGNEISSFIGIIEISILLASYMYFFHAIYFIDHTAYNEIIKTILKKRDPDNLAEFYMGSLFPKNYTWDILSQVGGRHSATVLPLSVVVLIVAVGMYAPHWVATYLSIIHILEINVFGFVMSVLIIVLVLLINLGTLALLVVTHVYLFKFRGKLERADP